jgi:hypothetical protein
VIQECGEALFELFRDDMLEALGFFMCGFG